MAWNILKSPKLYDINKSVLIQSTSLALQLVERFSTNTTALFES